MNGTLSLSKKSQTSEMVGGGCGGFWHRAHLFFLDPLIFARMVFGSTREASLPFLKMMMGPSGIVLETVKLHQHSVTQGQCARLISTHGFLNVDLCALTHWFMREGKKQCLKNQKASGVAYSTKIEQAN